MPTNNSRRVRAYEQRLKAKGYVRVTAWIPATAEARTQLQSTARMLRNDAELDAIPEAASHEA